MGRLLRPRTGAGAVSLRIALAAVRDVVLGMLPHRAPTGLVPVGDPDREAPVLVTGNYTKTVRRLRRALSGQHVWLVCANSKGMNVWCAAGGGHLTHHDVIAALRVSGVESRVDHRELVLPQLCATGVERRVIAERTGWRARWGPARLEDLPDFLARGRGVKVAERFMRFPLRERLEMAATWGVPLSAVATIVLGAVGGWRLALSAVLCVAVLVTGPFVALPWLGLRGARRWLSPGIFGAAGITAGAALLVSLSAATQAHLVALIAAGVVLAAVLSVDIAGTTPWYPSTINAAKNPLSIELVEDRCTGAAECVQVCPRDVLAMNGRRHEVEIRRPDQCIRCGACIVQCPEDALRFRRRDGGVVEPSTVRRTRLNMLGERAVEVAPVPPPRAGRR